MQVGRPRYPAHRRHPPIRSLVALTLASACAGSPGGCAETPALLPELGACDIYDVPAITGLDALKAVDDELDAVVRLRMGVARPHRPLGHVFSPDVVHPGGGPADWSLPDHVVRTTGARGIRLFVTLNPSTEVRDVDRPGIGAGAPREQVGAWRDFVRALVERYDGDGVDDMPGLALPVAAWEVANEPFCSPGDGRCHVDYFELVRASYQAAKTADPGATVMVGGAAPLLHTDGNVYEPVAHLYRDFFARGGAAYTDALPFHVVVGSTEPPLEDVLAAWRDIAGDTPLWLTEIGLRDARGNHEISAVDAKAAGWMVDQLDLAFGAGVERVFLCKALGRLDDPPELVEALQAWADARARRPR
ncbi:MAG: hypothetical protein H6739_10795 [Alphaproteobacteria bacterium]|nr:hypothetical protein [Alphaproteobacteria bacterium]